MAKLLDKNTDSFLVKGPGKSSFSQHKPGSCLMGLRRLWIDSGSFRFRQTLLSKKYLPKQMLS